MSNPFSATGFVPPGQAYRLISEGVTPLTPIGHGRLTKTTIVPPATVSSAVAATPAPTVVAFDATYAFLAIPDAPLGLGNAQAPVPGQQLWLYGANPGDNPSWVLADISNLPTDTTDFFTLLATYFNGNPAVFWSPDGSNAFIYLTEHINTGSLGTPSGAIAGQQWYWFPTGGAIGAWVVSPLWTF